MNKTDQAYDEATRKLEAFLKSGVQGFFTQAVDRLTDVGMDCSRIGRDENAARHLLAHILR